MESLKIEGGHDPTAAAAYVSHTKYNNTFIFHINMNMPDEGLLDSYGNDVIVLNTLEISPVTFSL